MSALSTLYARHEPPSDPETAAYSKASGWVPSTRHLEVVIYNDPEAQKMLSRYPWHYSSKPTKRNRYIMHNCNRYRLIWLSAKAVESAQPCA